MRGNKNVPTQLVAPSNSLCVCTQLVASIPHLVFNVFDDWDFSPGAYGEAVARLCIVNAGHCPLHRVPTPCQRVAILLDEMNILSP